MDKAVKNAISVSVEKQLKEIKGSVDDKLHGHIMALVAKRRTKTELEDRLKSYLEENTDRFVFWLMKLLEDFKCYNRSKSLKSKFLSEVKKEVGDSEVDVLNLILNPQSYEVSGLLPKDDTECALSVDEIPEAISKEILKVSEGVPKSVCNEISKKASKKVPKDGPKTVFKESSRKENVLQADVEQHAQPKICRREVHKSQTSNNRLRSDFVFRRRDINKRKRSDTSSRAITDEEYDPLYPSFSSSEGLEPSAKKATAANFPTPSSLSGAMDEANASVLGKDKTTPVYWPTPLKILAVGPENGRNVHRRDFNRKTTVQDAIKMGDCNNKLVRSEKNQMKRQQLLYPPLESNPTISKKYVTQQPKALIAESAEVRKCLVSVTSDNANETPAEDRYHNLATSHRSNSNVHGVLSTAKPTNLGTLSDKPLSENSNSQDLFQFNQISRSQPSLQQKQEVLSKMHKLFKHSQLSPLCKKNKDCSYHQRNVLCKAFPNCKFLDKCFYIHPKCKFGLHCTLDNCPYTHANRKNLPQNSDSRVQFQTMKKPVTPQSCKFYPNCNVYRCPYLHPKKKCRFGTNCTALNCPFLHQSFPVQGKFKWISTQS